jgi:thiol-disulfide isomerase/thioredoxin
MYTNYLLRITFFSLSMLLTAGLAMAQDKQYEELTVNPQPILQGQKITIRFNPEKSELSPSQEPIFAVVFAYDSGKSQAFDVPLTASRNIFQGTFSIPANTDAVSIKIIRGKQTATNNGRGYYFKVNTPRGTEQSSTYYSLSYLQNNGREAGITKRNQAAANAFYNKWFNAQDLERMPFFEKAIALSAKGDSASLCSHLSRLAEAKQLTESQLSMLIVYAKPCGAKAVSTIEAAMKSQYPQGRWYWNSWFDSVKAAKTVLEKRTWIKAFQMAYPDDLKNPYPLATSMYLNVMATAASSLDLATFTQVLQMLDSTKVEQNRILANINTLLLESLRRDSLIDETLPLARMALQLTRISGNPVVVPQGQSTLLYTASLKEKYLHQASIYGRYLQRKGKADSAVFYTKEAAYHYDLKNTGYNDSYFTASESVLPAEENIAAIKIAIAQEAYNNHIKEIFLRLYASTGSTDGAAVLESLLAARMQKIKAQLKEGMLNKKAPHFVLPGLHGGEVSLTSLRGKVVLIDFWATWCGPCISSFPSMQQLVDANKHTADRAFLFVDVWQKETDKYAVVNDFFRTKPFRFDVYMDLKDEVVKSFEVSGIPTKVIIDKNGIIRFISVGFYGDDTKAIEELQAMLELAAEAS